MRPGHQGPRGCGVCARVAWSSSRAYRPHNARSSAGGSVGVSTTWPLRGCWGSSRNPRLGRPPQRRRPRVLPPARRLWVGTQQLLGPRGRYRHLQPPGCRRIGRASRPPSHSTKPWLAPPLTFPPMWGPGALRTERARAHHTLSSHHSASRSTETSAPAKGKDNRATCTSDRWTARLASTQ